MATPGKRWMDFDYDAWGDHSKGWGAGFGFEDLKAAQRMGYTNPQIRILAQRAEKQGRTVGKLTWDKVNKLQPPGSMPWDYGGVGGAEFGMADLNMALGQGADYNKIKGYADYAREHGIGVGSEAESWLRHERGVEEKREQLGATNKLLEDQNKALLAIAQKEVPVQEPPKPQFRPTGGQFVPGTTRFQGYTPTAKKGRRSGTLRDRFRRTGQGFSTALSIGGSAGGGGAASSKVLNV